MRTEMLFVRYVQNSVDECNMQLQPRTGDAI